ncbi:hypothetical protein DB30_06066 [Enhygromyxa salina]|uniref:Uncharacterized protein n=1 Tax=Enhygromyxa salina TaxID=215803 RepID=A0A0C1ZBE7_9BACT|nr:hypothetical protein [Enhygromyxa salina]KIG15034.1 hypothetical protein DB30_06066 [Enhygromyxa salina]
MAEARAESAAGKPATDPAAKPDGGRSFWLFVALSFAVALAVLLGLALGAGAELNAPTLALAVAGVVMIWALRAMWGIVVALARPGVQTLIVEADLGADHSSFGELREEKRRVLRAIKELEFDHAMGKLSDEDFRQVGDRYRLRAIEVMRLLDDDDQLHPQLAEHLAALGLKLAAAGVTPNVEAGSNAKVVPS